MGREVRRVPASWEHPRRPDGRFQPLEDGYTRKAENWDRENAAWERGEHRYQGSYPDEKYEQFAGPRPVSTDYMPDWPEDMRTHYQMYENTSEGSPISPVMASPEELARWLADNGASAFASMKATYEEWLAMCRGGWAPSMAVAADGEIMSGVALAGREGK
jgi:hypothetical protein